MEKHTEPAASPAEILREYGPFPGVERVHGVTFDGERVWIAGGEKLVALDPATGASVRELAVPADAGTAYDGEHLWQLAGGKIRKVDPASGRVVATIPSPAPGRDSGLAWAEGLLWVGEYRGKRIHQVDPETGKVLRTIESDRLVTGVTFVDGDLWHGALDDERAEVRRVDPATGAVRERVELPAGAIVSGLESDGAGVLYCGGGPSGKLRAVRRPRR